MGTTGGCAPDEGVAVPVAPERLAELYDRISLRVTRGIKRKFEQAAEAENVRPTELFELMVSRAYEQSTRKVKKERRKG
jgi:hypothetical protein